MKLSQETMSKATVTVTEPSPSQRVLEVSLSADEAQRLRGVYLRGLTKDMTLPGFRKGKVPFHLVQAQLGESAEQGLVLELGKAFLDRYAHDQHFPVVRTPHVTSPIASDGGLKLRIEVDVVPPFELPPYKALPARLQRRTVTEADVEEFLRQRTEQLSTLLPKKEPLSLGDAARLRVQRVAPGGIPLVGEPVREVMIRLDLNEAPPELVNGLVGLMKDATTRITLPREGSGLVKAPKGADEGSLYAITVVDALTVEPPEPARVAQEFGIDDPEELPIRVRVLLEDEMDRHARAAMRGELVARIARNASLHLPLAMVDEHIEDIRTSLVETAHRQGKEPDSDLLDPQFFAERHRDQIRHGMKELLIVDAIATTEGLLPTHEQIQAAIGAQAHARGLSAKQAVKQMDDEDLQALIRRITRVNVERFLEDEAEVELAEMS
ncbi:hypothetical protein JXA88_09460 [Candidatus Fermentibacteria bacterium]|nr:hypothetical protein [Candidatus Fermentibacteria bacterium]